MAFSQSCCCSAGTVRHGEDVDVMLVALMRRHGTARIDDTVRTTADLAGELQRDVERPVTDGNPFDLAFAIGVQDGHPRDSLPPNAVASHAR
jgi:hypothetical protein